MHPNDIELMRKMALDTAENNLSKAAGEHNKNKERLRDEFAMNINIDDFYHVNIMELVVGREKPQDAFEELIWASEFEANLRYIKSDAMLKARSKS